MSHHYSHRGDRIYGRFLNIIADAEKKLFSGFAVLALDCLLCETLQQFYDGEDESKSPTGDFVRFLTSSPFNRYFGTDNTPKTSMAAVFYNQFRCGILHQAEVKKTSLIKIEDKYSLVDWSDNQHTGLIVNRKKFHQQLVQEFSSYLVSLRNQPVIPSIQPWDNFKKKMDLICRMSQVYFAYGSNMKTDRMTKRVPSAKPLGYAKLVGKKLVFNKISSDGSGKTNIVRSKNSVVLGVLFEVNETDIVKLDGIEKGYKKQDITVLGNNDKPLHAFTYVSTQTKDGLKPYDRYLNFLVQGAEENGLPKDYVDSLRKFESMLDTRKK